MGDIPMRIYEFGPFRVDPLRRVLLRETNEVRLPAKSFCWYCSKKKGDWSKRTS